MDRLCVLQNLVPYVWELMFPQVPIKCRVIYMDVHSLLDVPCDSLWLPINNGKTFRADQESCRVIMVVDGGWSPKILLEPVPKCSTRFSYILFWAVDVWTFKFINDSTLL